MRALWLLLLLWTWLWPAPIQYNSSHQQQLQCGEQPERAVLLSRDRAAKSNALFGPGTPVILPFTAHTLVSERNQSLDHATVVADTVGFSPDVSVSTWSARGPPRTKSPS
ncbi:MAG: hypothetical protein AB7K71_03075 [Polyangiaceae bacterium]